MSKQNVIIVNANQLLDAATTNGVPVFEGIGQLGLDARAEDTLRATIMDNLANDFDGKVFIGGTGQLREHANLTSEETATALACLKGTGRMLQIGKGRGKGLVVINPKHLTQADWNALLASGSAPSTEAAPTALPAATAGSNGSGAANLEARVADLEVQVRSLLEAVRGVRNATSSI